MSLEADESVPPYPTLDSFTPEQIEEAIDLRRLFNHARVAAAFDADASAQAVFRYLTGQTDEGEALAEVEMVGHGRHGLVDRAALVRGRMRPTEELAGFFALADLIRKGHLLAPQRCAGDALDCLANVLTGTYSLDLALILMHTFVRSEATMTYSL